MFFFICVGFIIIIFTCFLLHDGNLANISFKVSVLHVKPFLFQILYSKIKFLFISVWIWFLKMARIYLKNGKMKKVIQKGPLFSEDKNRPNNYCFAIVCNFICQSVVSSVTQSCPNLCDPMDCSTAGLPVHHQLPELSSCALSQRRHPTISSSAIHPHIPSPPSFNLSSIRVFYNKSVILIKQPKYWSFSLNISPSNEYSGLPLGLTGWISLQSKGLSRVFSNTTVQNHQLFGTRFSKQSNSHIKQCFT